MNPERVNRAQVHQLTDLPNIGPRMAAALTRIDILRPEDLIGRDPLGLYQELCVVDGERVDPCALDAMISITRFMAGEAPRVWWYFTPERKRQYPDL